MLTASTIYAADNEIYVDQSGTGANIDLEQLGISNIIGGLNSTAGNLTAFDLDGNSMTLDINMIGATNKFLGDKILSVTIFLGLYFSNVIAINTLPNEPVPPVTRIDEFFNIFFPNSIMSLFKTLYYAPIM